MSVFVLRSDVKSLQSVLSSYRLLLDPLTSVCGQFSVADHTSPLVSALTYVVSEVTAVSRDFSCWMDSMDQELTGQPVSHLPSDFSQQQNTLHVLSFILGRVNLLDRECVMKCNNT